MNIIRKLALKNLTMNKKRTISTIIGIVLSTALICGTTALVTSFQGTLVQNSVNQTGYYHAKLINVNEDEIKSLRENKDLSRNT